MQAHKTSQWREIPPLTASVLDAENLSGVKPCYSEINSAFSIFKMKLKEVDVCRTVRWPALEHSPDLPLLPRVLCQGNCTQEELVPLSL